MIEFDYICQKCELHTYSNAVQKECSRCGTPFPKLKDGSEFYEKIRQEKLENEDFVLEETETQKPLNLFSQGWKLSIEESTSELTKKNIVVLVNKKGQHLFMRAVKLVNGFIELAPITRQEAQENSINFEESLNQSYFDMDIEESISEPEKVTHQFNSKDPESMKKAAQTALEISNRLTGGKARITESTEQTQENDVETIKSERDTYKSMLDLVAQKEFEKKKAQLNAPDTITTVEELKAFSEGKKSAQPQRVPSGTIPWQTQQETVNPQGFSSFQEMCDHVRDLASSSNPDKNSREENKRILDQLMIKALRGQRETKQDMVFTQPKDLSLNDILNAKYQRRKKLAKGV